MSNQVDVAIKTFNDGFSCSQAVLVSHCEEYGLDSEMALKVAGAFGGGMGHIGETCGAVTGALMLLGLKYGKTKAEDTDSNDRTYAKVKEFTDMFKQKHGSIKCKDLIEFDISVKEELTKAKEAGVFKTVCPLLVKDSIEMVERLL
jgi:C_GCAxxG_C_C family probable redox protein